MQSYTEDTFEHEKYQDRPARNAQQFVMVNYKISVRFYDTDIYPSGVISEEKYKIIAGFENSSEAKSFINDNMQRITEDFNRAEEFQNYRKISALNDVIILYDREHDIEYIFGQEIDYNKVREELQKEFESRGVTLLQGVHEAEYETSSNDSYDEGDSDYEEDAPEQDEPDDDFGLW